MDIGEVLISAWKTIWKHKVLWLVGILASFGSSGGGNSGSSSSYRYSNGEYSGQFNQFQRMIESVPGWVWILLIIALVLLLVAFAVIGTIGRISLIKGVNDVEEGAEKLHFFPLLKSSLRYFWRFFLHGLLVFVVIVIIMLVIMVPMILLGVMTKGIGALLLIPILCCLVPVFIVLGLYLTQCQVSMVVEDLGVMDGFKRGWEVTQKSPGWILLTGLILGTIDVVISLVASIPVFILVLPPLIAIATRTEGVIIGSLAMVAVLFCLYLPVLLLVTGILESYILAGWTIAFRRLTGRASKAGMPGGATPAVPPSFSPLDAMTYESPAPAAPAVEPPPFDDNPQV